MRRSLIFVCLLAVGCSSEEKPALRPFKNKGLGITISNLERAIDPMLGKNYTDSFIMYLGQKEIAGADDSFRSMLRSVANPSQPYVGAAGAAKRKELTERLKSIETESKECASSEKPNGAVNLTAGVAAQRIGAELTLARCLLEEGDSAGAADAFLQALDWTDKTLMFGGGIQTVLALHVLRERAYGVAQLMVSDKRLTDADVTRIVDALKAQSNMRKVVATGVAFGYRNTVLNPLFTVYSIRSEKQVVANIISPKGQNKTAEQFVNKLFEGKDEVSNPVKTAKLVSDATMATFDAAQKNWPQFLASLELPRKAAISAWGVDPLKITADQMADAAYLAKLRETLSSVENPGGIVQTIIYMRDFPAPHASAFVLDGQDTAKLASVIAAKKKRTGATATAADFAGLIDPVSGSAFTLTAGGLKSPYTPTSTDPDEIKTYAGTVFKL